MNSFMLWYWPLGFLVFSIVAHYREVELCAALREARARIRELEGGE